MMLTKEESKQCIADEDISIKLTTRFNSWYLDLNGTLWRADRFNIKFRNCKFIITQYNFGVAIFNENVGDLQFNVEFILWAYYFRSVGKILDKVNLPGFRGVGIPTHIWLYKYGLSKYVGDKWCVHFFDKTSKKGDTFLLIHRLGL